jgi:hypothetical protein
MPSATAALVAADGVVERLLAALHLRLGGRAHLDDGDAAGQLGEALLQLLAVVVAGRLLDLSADLPRRARSMSLLVAAPADDGGVLAVDDDAVGAAELLQLNVLQLEAELLGNHLPAGQHRDVLQHRLAPVAEAGRLHGDTAQHAAQGIDDERGQRLALDVLGNEQHRPAALRRLLQQRDHVLEGADLAVAEQHVDVLVHRLHLLGVGDEVGRDVAAVELHAFDDLEHGFGGLGFLEVMTPSSPIFSMASATSSPIVSSLCAEMVATWAFSVREPTGRDRLRSLSTATFRPRSRPRLMSMALAPATTLRTPSAKIAWARMVEVLVPSPTASPVRSAAWRSIWAPRFCSGSFRSNSLAMVTPSLQTRARPISSGSGPTSISVRG